MDSGGAFYIIVLKDFWHQSQGKPNGSVITNQNILYWIIWGEYSFTLVVLFVCLKKSNRNIFISGSSKLKFLIICQLTHSTTHADIYSVWINILDDAAGVLWNSFYGCFHSFYCSCHRKIVHLLQLNAQICAYHQLEKEISYLKSSGEQIKQRFICYL